MAIAIRELREEYCLTQQQLGDICHLTRTSIANIEAGKQRILLHTLVDLSDALNTNLFNLVKIPKNKINSNATIARWRNRAWIAENKIKSIRKVLNRK